MRIFSLTLTLLCLLQVFASEAKHKPLNSFSYIVVDVRPNTVSKTLKQNIHAFNITESKDLDDVLSTCKNHLQTHPQSVYFIFANRIPKEVLAPYKKQIYYHHEGVWPSETELAEQGKHFIIFDNKSPNDELSISFQKSITLIASPEVRNKHLARRDFFWYEYSVTDSLFRQKMYNFWDFYTHPVNFIHCPPSLAAVAQQEVNLLNKEKSFIGYFSYKGKALDNCYFRQNMNRAPICGFFCTPFQQYLTVTPERIGVRFHPDVLCITKENEGKFISIEATGLPLTNQELIHLQFGRSTKTVNSTAGDSYLENIDFRKDSLTGKKYAYFNGESNQITFSPGIPTGKYLELSAAIVFKSDKNTWFHALISQGKTFSFKTTDKKLIFTLPGRKDYVLQNIKFSENEWMHICLTIHQGRLLKVYNNGKLAQTLNIMETSASNEKIQIGNNDSFEMFRGYMSEIRIWNRTLSEFDIAELQKQPSQWAYLLWLLIPFLAALIFFRFRKRKVVNEKLPEPENQAVSVETIDFRNSILFFDGLAVYNQNGENLAIKMTPKVRFLFAVIAVHSFKGGISTKELTDVVWPGMNKEAAKNNRSTSIAMLRELLLRIPAIQLVYEHRSWFLTYDSTVYVDYKRFQEMNQQFEQKSPDANELSEYCSLIRGKFLRNIENEWSDDLKNRIHESALHHLEQYTTLPFAAENPKLLVRMAQAIYAIEDLSEEALELELRAARLLNKPDKERNILERFSKKYEAVYGVPYKS